MIKIEDIDYSEIQRQFNEVIAWSQGIDNPVTDDLFKRWVEAKIDFIRRFGGLIYELPQEVSFDLSESAKIKRVEELSEKVRRQFGLVRLSNFIYENKNNFFENVLKEEYKIRSANIIIPKGMKIIKAFKFFVDDPETLTTVQDMASMIIQENKIKGKLCFSVHPLDFLSSSENNLNWRSCHALDGEYRAGNLSYMVDKSTIICYLKETDEEVVLPNFPKSVPWNNKKWRMLLFFSDDFNMIFAGRQYPFTSETAPDVIKREVNELFGAFGDWYVEKLTSMVDKKSDTHFEFRHKYVPVGDRLIAMDKLIIEGEQAMNYNDLLRSSFYDPIYAYRKFDTWFNLRPTGKSHNINTKFHIGGPVKCLDCGNDNISISETMRCIRCEEDHGNLDSDEFGYCACCGRHMYLEDAHWVQDEPICDRCYGLREVVECTHCGELVWEEDVTYDEAGDPYCSWCAER